MNKQKELIECRCVLERNFQGEFILYIVSGPKGSTIPERSMVNILDYIEKMKGSNVSTYSIGYGFTLEEARDNAMERIKDTCEGLGIKEIRGGEL